jgi:hypothetical protein
MGLARAFDQAAEIEVGVFAADNPELLFQDMLLLSLKRFPIPWIGKTRLVS